MARRSEGIIDVEAPVTQALVIICEKCGRRAGNKHANPSHRLASHIKRGAKKTFGRNSIRAVISSCMKICPDDGIAVSIVPGSEAGGRVLHLVAEVDDVDAMATLLLQRCRDLGT